ncbi:MAG: 6-phosphogluconolactonase [Candidatus Sericytochromatia bacterium]|nr:6-phosphogluconolactonase [Candidatus Sericytochromatia bacterium]
MQVTRVADAGALAERGAALLAQAARTAVAERGRCCLAVSGGSTPGAMLRAFARLVLPWERIHLFQVDERIAPDGDPHRNWVQVQAAFAGAATGVHLHAMPVTLADPEAAAKQYAETLAAVCGRPAVLDLVHLGLGADGHTASLVPGDPALAVTGADVTPTGPYQGCARLTLTYPMLARARAILWVMAGADKAPMLVRLLAGDPTIPAGRVPQDRAQVLADAAAGDGL